MHCRRLPIVLILLAATPGLQAQALPSAALLQARLGAAPQPVTVIEPHLSVGGQQVRLSYLGYPAAQVLAAHLGRDWQTPGKEIEFRALDGYVSRIPVERFGQYRAYLVLARQDGSDFVVDNPGQNEKRVALGPYYLVWDNIAAPELLADGGSGWPYQVAQIALRNSSRTALLPAGLAPGFEAPAALAQKFCLSCHQVNGFGGDKMPLNLAVRAKQIDGPTWQRWLLNPSAVKPGTAMPPLPDTLPEREAVARQLHDYLKALPVSE
jgi:mono/diheme cytochrome c family protein